MSMLVFFVKNFPYGIGENFIDNEIEYLMKGFDKVLICTCDRKGNREDSRVKLGDNVEIISTTSRSFWDKLGIVMRMPFNMFLKDDKEYIKGNFKRRVFRAYMMSSYKLMKKKLYKKILKAVGTEKDVVCYSYWFHDLAILAGDVARAVGGKTVARAHGYDLYEYLKSANYIPFRKKILKNANVYACSKQGREYLKERYSEYADKISCSYLGTLDRGVQNERNEGVPVIISCSTLVPIKRVNLLIEALKVLQQRNVKFFWKHCGLGELEEEIKAFAKNNLNDNSYEFCGAFVNSKLMEKYKEEYYKVFVNVSSNEGLPVSIMEAISFGIPVVATNVGGTSEAVTEQTGYLVDKNATPEEIADAIQNILSMNDENYNKLRHSCRFFWENNFSAKNNYEKFVKEIKE